MPFLIYISSYPFTCLFVFHIQRKKCYKIYGPISDTKKKRKKVKIILPVWDLSFWLANWRCTSIVSDFCRTLRIASASKISIFSLIYLLFCVIVSLNSNRPMCDRNINSQLKFFNLFTRVVSVKLSSECAKP